MRRDGGPARRRGRARARRAAEGARPPALPSTVCAPAVRGEYAAPPLAHPDAAAPDPVAAPDDDAWDAERVDAILCRLAAASTRAELAAIAAPDLALRGAHTFTAETARALHLLLSSGPASDGSVEVSTLRRVARMADWLAERARTEPVARGACALATDVAAELRVARAR